MSAPRPRWRPAYIGLGSNLNSPRQQIEEAVAALGTVENTVVVKTSPLYRSAPVDGSDQPDYINAVVALLTQLDARSLLDQLRKIELAQGRKRDGNKWGPRVLDLDLLVYSNAVINQEDLVVPHPGIAERNFVLLPLLDIAAHLRIPGLGPVTALAGRIDRTSPRIERLP